MPHLLFRYEITVYSTSHAPNKEMMKRRNRRAVIASWHTLLCASEYYYYFAPSNLFHRRIDSSTLCLYAFWRIYIFVDSTLNSHVHSYELQIDLTCDICTLFELDLGARGSEVVNIKIYLIRWWCYDEDAYKESEKKRERDKGHWLQLIWEKYYFWLCLWMQMKKRRTVKHFLVPFDGV